MKDLNKARILIYVLFISFIMLPLVACSNSSSPNPNPKPNPKPNPEDRSEINTYVNSLPDWQTPVTQSTDSRDPEKLKGSFDVDGKKYTCTTEEKNIQNNYEDIIFAGINSDTLYPGALLQGKGIPTGVFDSVRLARSPVTLTIDLNIENPSIEIDNPTTANMRTKISELIRRADTRLGEIDVIPGKVSYERAEAHTFEQSLTSIGISAGYKSGFNSIDADFNFGTGRTVNSHTIIVRFFQPMFTISFDENSIREPASFFANSVTKEDLETEEAAGRIGNDNLPVYVKSVTYGRMLFYTLTSEQVSSYQELEAAVSGVYGAFSGSAEITDKQRSTLTNSRERLMAFGGSQNAALAAITDLNKFFVPAFATTAVPISYVVKNLDGSIAKIGDTTTFHVQSCTSVTTPTPDKQIIVHLSDVDGRVGFSVCSPKIPSNCDNLEHLYTEKSKDIVLNNYSSFFVNDEVRFHIKLWNPGCWGWGLSLQVQTDGVFQKVTSSSNRRSLTGGSGLYCDRITEVDWQYLANKKTGKITVLK